ncbi:MAG TPA: hypothetical protein PLX68_11200 [Dermatophilaceae bacterium]|nr:hypothetical protein [Dermatophilaceae bacterium]
MPHLRTAAGMPSAHRPLPRPVLGGLAITLLLTGCLNTADPSGASRPSVGSTSAGSLPSTPPSGSPSISPTPTSTTAAAGAAATGSAASTSTSLPPAGTLPGGGTRIFPEHRLVGYSGYPGSPALGRLGVGNLDDRAAEITTLAGQYAAGRRPLPVFELIATVVHARPGPDGLYRTRIDQEIVRRHLDAARRHGAILLLNIQPGRAAFLDEVKHWEPWLREPDVGLALDPEWAVKAGQIPGKVFGRTTGAELDAIAAYVAGIVAANRLPEKVVLYHQLHTSIVREPAGLRPHPGVALVVSVDGIGTPGQKTATWRSIVAVTPEHVHKGFKLFYDEDTATGPLMTPTQVLGLTPQPEYVLYE